MELTASLRKSVVALADSRGRREQNCFVAEGTKCVLDTFGFFRLKALFSTQEWSREHTAVCATAGEKLCVCPRRELQRLSSLSTAPDVIAVYHLPEQEFCPGRAMRDLVIALDGVQDPGNVGTIIRAADWFGIHDVWLSADSADAFSPKTIMATMGAISRCRVCRGDLVEMIGNCPEAQVYGTFLDGDNIFTSHLAATGIIVLGNEGRGISPGVAKLVTRRLTIPPFPAGEVTSESLNVGMAASVTMAEFRRREYGKV